MEFIFSDQLASFEAVIVLLCIGLIATIFLYDGYLFLARVFGVLTPRKEYVKEKQAGEPRIETTIPSEPIQLAELEAILPHTMDMLEASSEAWENISWDVESITEWVGIESTIVEEVLEEENVNLIETNTGTLGEEDIESMENELPETLPLEESSNTPPEEVAIPAETPAETKEELITTPTEEETITPEYVESEMPIVNEEDTWVREVNNEEVILEANNEEDLSVNEIQPTDEVFPEVIEEITLPEEDSEEEQASKTDEKPEKSIVRNEAPIATSSPEKPASTPTLSPEKREKLVTITNTVRTLVARGHIVEARGLIIEWLSLSKMHRELNLILWELYERDHAFEKAEFIYKDLAHTYDDDIEILMHLAASLAMQRKYRLSYEFYKKIIRLNGESEELLYTLAHLASELGETDEMYGYARSYDNQYPKNPEILWLLSQSLITRGSRREAIEILIKLKNLTPYNKEIMDLIQKLVVEEEMAGNFGGEK